MACFYHRRQSHKLRLMGTLLNVWKAVLQVLKYNHTESARIEYGILLAALAPQRLTKGDQEGMIKKVADRLL